MTIQPRIAGIVVSGLISCWMPASHAAQTTEFSALSKAKKFAEMERAANVRPAADPDNAEALAAKVEAMLAEDGNIRVDEAVKLAERCIAANPRHSGCHESLGNALGTKALNSGILSALGYAGKIRDAFRHAVDLDPRNVQARFSLLQFYLTAPSIAGGGAGKAKTFAEETMKTDPEAGKLMLAAIASKEGQLAKAEVEALQVNGARSDALADRQRDTLWTIGMAYVGQRKFSDGERIFREVQKRFPGSGLGTYGLARSLQEQGRNLEAIPLFEKALAAEPHAFIFYRMGKSLQTSGDKTRAIAAYEKALSFKPILAEAQRSDAEDQIKTLKR
ncbi:MAG TPA: tetratricopeptide repeat protein [Paucimonas sp.]|nr:tetratricopeptide repeat protein [Paucimonas sp.]